MQTHKTLSHPKSMVRDPILEHAMLSDQIANSCVYCTIATDEEGNGVA